MARRKAKEGAAPAITVDAEEPTPEVKPERDGSVEINIEDHEDDAESPEEAQLSRREKKQARAGLREENERLRQQALENERKQGELVGYLQAQEMARRQQTQPDDPFARKRADLRERQQLLVKEFELKGAKLTAEERDGMMKRGYDLEDEMRTLAAEEVLAKRQPGQPAQNPALVILQSEFPALFNPQNRTALGKAILRHQEMVLDGNPDDLATARKAAKSVMEKEGLGEREEPRENPRRYEGTSTGASGAGSKERPGKVTLTKDDVRAARAMYPHLPEAKAYRQYAQEVLLDKT